MLGPIVNSIPVPNTDTTVTFTKITDKSPTGATQAQSLMCVAEGLTQVFEAITKEGSTSTPHELLLSGTGPENANCLSLRDLSPRDGLIYTYGIAAEALQGVFLQISNNNTAAGNFQVHSKSLGYVGYGSIAMWQ